MFFISHYTSMKMVTSTRQAPTETTCTVELAQDWGSKVASNISKKECR